MDRRLPRVRSLALGALALLVAGCFAACGARSNLFSPPGQGGGGGHGGFGGGPGGALSDGGPGGGAGGLGGGSGGSGGSGGGAGGSCTPNGEVCAKSADCCDGECNEESYCGAIPCQPEYANCTFNSDCCKMHCIPGVVGKQCNQCLLQGKDCAADGGIPCCNGPCVADKCQPPPCVPNGEPINPMFNTSCCSKHFHKGYCAPGVCYVDNFPCVSIWDCCSHACTAGRCGKVIQCQLPGQPCAGDDDCCHYDCNGGTCGATGCTANGQPCVSAIECCSSKCNIGAGTCAVNMCSPDAVACKADSDCCSGHCVNGACNEAACLPDGDFCNDPSPCCSGTCPIVTGTCGGLGG